MAPYFNPYMQQTQQQFFPQQQMMPQQNNMQMQNNGFVSVRTEGEAFNYPVAPGNCVTFKVEGQPIVLEKSMGFSQLEAPKIERYRLVKEDMPVASRIDQNEPESNNVIENTVNDLKDEIARIRDDVDDLKNKIKPATKKPSVKEKEDE